MNRRLTYREIQEARTNNKSSILVLTKGIAEGSTPYCSINRPGYGLFFMNQVQAIVLVRKIAEKEGIKTIIFEYTPHNSVWFLDDYLDAHPKIKRDVLKAEKSLWRKILERFR